jgi:GTP-binding protein HflX
MAQIFETDEEIERVILVGVQLDDDDDAESSLEELKELADTAGAVTVGRSYSQETVFIRQHILVRVNWKN